MKRLLALAIALMLSISLAAPAFAASSEAQDAADALNRLGLFQGKGTDANGKPLYALDDVPTRQEAVTMLVRLLGKENEARTGTWEIPFTDVDSWAKPYVGYAYAHGITAGTGKATFGGKTTVTASQYLTFVLRALGYASGADFQWDAAWELSDKLGITDGRYDAGSRSFLRSDIALISLGALDQPLKGSEATLLETIQKETNTPAEETPDAPAEEAPEKPIVSEAVDPTLPVFYINGQAVPAAYGYPAKAGSYTVTLFWNGVQKTDLEVTSTDPSVCSVSANGDGSFTATALQDGKCTIRVYHSAYTVQETDENGETVTSIRKSRSDLTWMTYTNRQSFSPGVSLLWHGMNFSDGAGFGWVGSTVFVMDVLLDGEKVSDYTVTSDSASTTFTCQSDGSLLIEKPTSGVVRFTVTCGEKTASFSLNTSL